MIILLTLNKSRLIVCYSEQVKSGDYFTNFKQAKIGSCYVNFKQA